MNKGARIYERSSRVNGKTYIGFLLAYYEHDGRRIRRSFPTKAKAEKALKDWQNKQQINTEKQKILTRKIGEKAAKLGTDDLLDAVKALGILDRSSNLEAAAKFFVKHNRPHGGKIKIADCAEKFYEAKKNANCRPATIQSYRNLTGSFVKDMADRSMNEITLVVLEDWLSRRAFRQATRAAYLRHISAFFSFAVRKGYMVENPVSAIDKPRHDRKQVTYLTVNDARKLLAAASEHYPDMVPYLAIGLFAGLRPVEIHGEDSGHEALDWRDIDLVKGKIVVRPAQDKIRRGRNVTISENLRAWLMPYRRDAGPIFYQRRQFQGAVTKSEIKYSKDVLRHTFGTWHWALHRHEGMTADELGDTLNTVRDHYVNSMVDRADAEQYWSIAPVAANKQVIRITA